MLRPILNHLQNKRIVLASASPRRKELIKNLGLDVELCASQFEEDLDMANFAGIEDYVEETALRKVEEVYERLRVTSDKIAPDIVIGADTMVTLGNKIFGKPTTEAEAFKMLTELNGKSHIVYTGVVIKYEKGIRRFTEHTTVHFGKLTSEQIQAYIDTREPMDKAGGYGIQGIGGCMIERIEGDYFTVVGLPLYRLSCELCDIFGYKI